MKSTPKTIEQRLDDLREGQMALLFMVFSMFIDTIKTAWLHMALDVFLSVCGAAWILLIAAEWVLNRKIKRMQDEVARATAGTVPLICALFLAACSAAAPPADSPPPARSCRFEDLSGWMGPEPGWSMSADIWLTFTTGCEGRAVGVNAQIGRAEDRLEMRRPLVVAPEGFVRVVATMEAPQGHGELALEVRDVMAPWNVVARPSEQGIAEIKTWLPSGRGEIILRAQPAPEGAPLFVLVTDVLVETP